MILNCLQNTQKNTVDVIISTLPWTDTTMPLMAPAALKPIVEKAGMTCLAVDLNAEIHKTVLNSSNKDKLIDFFFNSIADGPEVEYIEDMFVNIAIQMLSWKPKFIGLSVFSYINRVSCEWLCYYLKKFNPDVKIILGGAGCLEQFSGPGDFANDLIVRGLADFHIRGDGEHSLYELLKGNVNYSGINSISWKELSREELLELPLPDYSNYDFSLYTHRMLPLQGSRGCVRKCTFCDYIENWKNFQWRSAESIFEEMLIQYQKYGIKVFKFQDTLVNGNRKEFSKLIRILANYNLKNPEHAFKWGGYFIFREKSPSDDEEWKMIADSGGDWLVVGIENLNEDIRYAIGKKFSNESITWHLEQATKYKINLELLFIIGYVNETRSHIDFSKKWLDQHVRFKDKLLLQWGGGLGIFPNTYLDRNKENLGIVMTGNQPFMWVNPDTQNTPRLRAEWTKELNQYSIDLGYHVVNSLDNHFLLEMLLNDEH